MGCRDNDKMNETLDDNKEEMQMKLSFEEKYAELLARLAELPCHTKEEKESRWKFFRSHSLYDEFVMDVLREYYPKEKKLKERIGNYLDIASYKNWGERKKDGLVLMEAIKDVICTYKGKVQEDDYGIVVYVKKKYKQMAGRASAKNYLDYKSLSDEELPERNLVPIFKICKAANELYDKECITCLNKKRSLRKIAEDLMEQSRYKYTKKDKEMVEMLLFGEEPVSVNQPVSEEGDMAYAELIGDERDGYKEALDKIENFCKNIETNWKIIMSREKLKNQQFFKIFFTRDILKVLKTDGSGNRYLKEPAGNVSVYEYMEEQGDFLYGSMFYRRYLERAFLQMPNDFYETYIRLLKEDFDFSDKVLAEVEGKDKSVISRNKDKYLDLMEAFRVYYMAHY